MNEFTRDEWSVEYDGSVVMGGQIVSEPIGPDGSTYEEKKANARLIAAANPAAISELLDRLEAAEKERDALRAKIEEMEKQEPVAEWLPLDSGEDTRRD